MGCATFQGAADKGASGGMIVEYDNNTPIRLDGDYIFDVYGVTNFFPYQRQLEIPVLARVNKELGLYYWAYANEGYVTKHDLKPSECLLAKNLGATP